MPHSRSSSSTDDKPAHPHTQPLRDKLSHLTSVLHEVKISAQTTWNPKHRHDEAHEIERDRKIEGIRDGHRFRSFAPEREGNVVKFHVDGWDYFWALGEVIEGARESIFILDWWLRYAIPRLSINPPIRSTTDVPPPLLSLPHPSSLSLSSLPTPPTNHPLPSNGIGFNIPAPNSTSAAPPSLYPQYRLDRLLKRKAEEGVRIYVSVYKEVEKTMTLNSRHTKHWLEDLHENIVVQRHPQHDYGELIYYWSHHEKLCVADMRVAAMGGLDACFGRWDTRNHPLADVHPTQFDKTLFPGQDYNNSRLMDFQSVDKFVSNALAIQDAPRMPWHDNSLTIIGPSVVDLCQHFIERWNFIKEFKYKHDRDFEYLALPSPFNLIQPSTAAAQEYRDQERRAQRRIEHPHLSEWAERGRQFFHPYHLPPSDYPRAEEKTPEGHCRVQVMRSATDWSHGIITETSIQDAYIQLIREANHTIYIENQFFVTSTGKDYPVKNQIGAALVERIISAAKDGRNFRVIIVIPALPAFAGEVQGTAAVKAIIEAQYRSINRGGTSIMECVRQAGYDPEKYISFWNLRSYDRVNSPREYIRKMEQNSGVTFHEAQVAMSRIWVGNPTGVIHHDETVQLERGINTSTDFGQSTKKQPVKGVRMPGSVEEAKDIVRRFEQGAERANLHVADNVGQDALQSNRTPSEEPWEGSEAEELECYVSELCYIHSKLMIIDDRRVICGSANLNDRSQMGERDSEIAICIEEDLNLEMEMDGKKYLGSKLASSWRRKLMREHLGLLPSLEIPDRQIQPTADMLPAPVPNDYDFGSAEDQVVEDMLSPKFWDAWATTGTRNRTAFEKVFRPIPNNDIRTWADYAAYQKPNQGSMVGHIADKNLSITEVKEILSHIKGHLVDMPLDFLIDVKELTTGDITSVNAWTLPIYL